MKVLFICRSNKGRSQMAEAFFNKYSKKNQASSAGTTPKAEGYSGTPPGEGIIEAMDTLGIDISKQKVKQVTPSMLKRAGVVVVFLGAAERKEHPLPLYFRKYYKKMQFWPIIDMRGVKSQKIIIQRAKRIKSKVEALVKKVG